MESIDPELRGSEEVSRPEATATATAAPATTSSYTSPETQADAKTNGTSDATTTNPQSLQSAQTVATDALPYFNGAAHDVTVPAPTYQPISFTPNEPRKRPRSCESCRGLKVKCEPSGEGSCKRCLKAGRECNYTESSGRRKKKQENKLAELEKQVTGLTAALLAQRGAEASDSMVFDESSILQLDPRETGASNGKRSRSEFEQDSDANTGRAAKHQLLSGGISGFLETKLDFRSIDRLAGEPVLQDFCASLRSLDSWFGESMKAGNLAPAKDENPAEINGNGNPESAANTTASIDAEASAEKSAPTAPMGHTPLDLLSQVASNEKPSAAGQGQDANKWYSPYAKANQDTSGYYNDNKSEDHHPTGSTATNVLEQKLQAEFGNRANLVMNFLALFLAGSSTTNAKGP